ncbi:PREDICTED: pectinesterase 2-like [Nelumbo nucifera]|uniref:Pectinesterase 2-like n=1 Tax=Nelumbo nucifera TaxID=4432 RepID=A0A1U8BIN5_NELNU|nr:PREDICTED: pectinesterase 2-like [Nelumbo nucifera]
MGKLVALGISLILVVGVVIGTVVGVNKGRHPKDDWSAKDIASGGTSTTMKSVSAICASADYKDSCIKTLTPQNTVTAQGKMFQNEETGIVIQNCNIVPDQQLSVDKLKIPSFLGRPWKKYATTIIMESAIGDFIRPEGWMPWSGNFALDTLFYAEYNNRGPGANTAQRVKWKGFKVITNRNEALRFTAGPFILGNEWLKNTGAPFVLGLKY